MIKTLKNEDRLHNYIAAYGTNQFEQETVLQIKVVKLKLINPTVRKKIIYFRKRSLFGKDYRTQHSANGRVYKIQ